MDFATLAKEIGGQLLNETTASKIFKGASIDSRTIKESELFIAIKGEKQDGHKYINDAIKKKCAGLIVSSEYPNISTIGSNIPVVVVENTHHSMMRLAAVYRQKLDTKIIGITGSNGKTTTKEFVYALLRSIIANCYRSSGNLNNLFGLPLAILGMPANSRYGVFELGISTPGEMTRLAMMARPDLVVITNIGPTHLETLGTVENVAEAKFELVDSVGVDKPVVLNIDDSVIMRAAARRQRDFFTYGFSDDADIQAEKMPISEDGFPMIKIDDTPVKIKLFGEHQAYNLLAAYAVCRVLGVNIKPDILNNIKYDFAPYRGEIENIDGLILISDCYNANPVSMKSGLESFVRYIKTPTLKGRRSFAVIGDMLELGEDAPMFHREIGKLLAQLNFDYVYTVGPLSVDIYKSAIDSGYNKNNLHHFENTENAGEALMTDIKRGDIVYIKASRGIGLEKIITLLKGAAFRQN
jgi:UDP-N-acetylmuramoyl-tripeptide--D-alanyl-D-alanine ligase